MSPIRSLRRLERSPIRHRITNVNIDNALEPLAHRANLTCLRREERSRTAVRHSTITNRPTVEHHPDRVIIPAEQAERRDERQRITVTFDPLRDEQ